MSPVNGPHQWRQIFCSAFVSIDDSPAMAIRMKAWHCIARKAVLTPPSHIAPVLASCLEEGIAYLAERAVLYRFHQFLEDVPA